MNNFYRRLFLTAICQALLFAPTIQMFGANAKHGTNPPGSTLFPMVFGTPPAHLVISKTEDHPLYSVPLHKDTAAFTQVPVFFKGSHAGQAAWCDIDNDGDLDLFLSGWSDTTGWFSKIYGNDGGAFTDLNADIVQIGTQHGVEWGDYDNDGDYDLAVMGRIDTLGYSPITKIYRNDNGTFADIHAPLMPLNGSSINWVDYDKDGDLDLFYCGSPDYGSTFFAKLYRNDNGVFTEVPTTIQGAWATSASWADYNGDGYPDLLLTGWAGFGISRIYRNNGDSTFTDIGAPLIPVVEGGAAWIDYDNDGLLDVSILGATYGHIPITKIYKNLGNDQFVDINANITQLEQGSLAWGDFDNDGWMDLAIAGSRDWYGDSAQAIIYRNDHGTFVDIGAALPGTWFSSLAWGDYNNDGKLDLIITGATIPDPTYDPLGPYQPITALFQNNTPSVNTKPVAPAAISAVVNNSSLQLQWNSGADAETPASVLTYNVRLGTSPDGNNIIGPNANPTNGFRRVVNTGNAGRRKAWSLNNLPAGRYYWSVQTIDNQFAGSSFTEERSFTINSRDAWSMVSVPYGKPDMHRSVLFPNATSGAFTYVGEVGYTSADLLETGKGYWVKFSPDHIDAVVNGASLAPLTIPVHEGWNMIGSIGASVPVSSVRSSTSGMEVTGFFTFSAMPTGYVASAAIQPGVGYWVKANQDGDLILGATEMEYPLSHISIIPTAERPPSPPGIDVASPADVPTAMRLEQNYPNPFNPSTVINYQLPVDGPVSLKIFNMLGLEVATVVDGFQNAGNKSVKVEMKNLPSGMYLYRLSAQSRTEVRKMVFIR